MIQFIRIALRLISVVFISYFLLRMYRNWNLKKRERVNLIAKIEFCQKFKIPLRHTSLIRNRKMCIVKGVKIDPGLFKDRFFLVSYLAYKFGSRFGPFLERKGGKWATIIAIIIIVIAAGIYFHMF